MVVWLSRHADEWNIVPATELRVQVTSSRVRIPDICALRRDAPREQVVTTPPLLCVEVLSRKDRVSRLLDVMEDYLAMGVEHLWVLESRERIAYTYTADGLLKAKDNRLAVPASPIYLDLPTIFSALD